MDTQEIYGDVLARAKRLSVEEIRRLVDDLNAKLEQPNKQEVVPQRRHKARDFRGVGKETWKGVDVEEYLRQERASWVSPTLCRGDGPGLAPFR